jgi:excisionase family DNA binding protein
MAMEIEGVTYYTAADICRELGVSRQTLWRWRSDGKIPAGRRFRDRQVLFTEDEVQLVREHANRLEPLDASATSEQLKLFATRGKGGR